MRKPFYKSCIAILLLMVLLLVGCGKKNSLAGTWTIQDGRFTVQAFFDDAYAEGPGLGTIEFTKDGDYILTDAWEYVSTGKYSIISDTVLTLEFQGTVNTYTYSLSGNELMLSYEDRNNYDSRWVRE